MIDQENRSNRCAPDPGNTNAPPAAPESACPADCPETPSLAAMSGMTISTRAPGSHPHTNPYAFLDPAQKPDEMGRMGHYRVLKLLGSGGMGMVFLAEDTRLERCVALKVMRGELAQNAVARQRFLREARAIAAVRNEHIIAIHDIDQIKDIPYFSSDLLQGMSLDVYLQQNVKLPASSVIELGLQIARGLEAAHRSGLVHRDIKPANIWLEPKDAQCQARSSGSDATAVRALSDVAITSAGFRVKILDFGLSRLADETASLTQHGMIVGTPTYMAPEQADSQSTDARSDLFSLGCVLYEAASGRRTFEGNSVISVLKATAMQEPKPLHELASDIPLQLSRIIMRLLSKDPEHRPQTASSVIEALTAAANEASHESQPRLSKVLMRLLSRDSGQKPRTANEVAAALVSASAEFQKPSFGQARSWLRSKYIRLGAIAVGTLVVGLIWLAPDWVPRPFVLNAQSNKDGGKSGHTPSGTMRGVTDDEIVVGITAPMSGPASDLGREMEIGLQTCFRQVNADGGIGGRKLRLVALNDRSDPERARANMAELFEDNRVFAVIGNVGTATAEKTVPYALQKKMVCFGPYTGAPLVRKNPPDRYVFNCRASFLEESTALVKYLIQSKEISAEQIAVFAEDGPYGDAGFNAAAKALRGHGRRGEQILRVSHKRNTTDVQSAVKELLRHNEIRAVIMATTYRPAAEFIHQVRDAKRDDVVFASLSCVGSDSLADELRQLGPRYPDGVIVMQCVPQPDSDCSAVLRYREALQAYYPSEQPAFISLEGYLNATLLVEGLRRAGPNLTTENFVDALEAIRDLDIGLGSTFHFGPSEHQASHKVWATVLDHAGHFQPLELE